MKPPQPSDITLPHSSFTQTNGRSQPVFSPIFLPRVNKRLALPARADTSHASPALTETAAPNPATPASGGSRKINTNRAKPLHPVRLSNKRVTSLWCQVFDRVTATQIMSIWPKTCPRARPTLRTLRGTSENWSKYTRLQFDAIARPTVLLSCTNDLKFLELADAKTKPPENHQDNGSTLPFNTQPYLPNSPPEDTSVDSAAPPPRPRIEAGNATLKVR